jgi:hypothetical protein
MLFHNWWQVWAERAGLTLLAARFPLQAAGCAEARKPRDVPGKWMPYPLLIITCITYYNIAMENYRNEMIYLLAMADLHYFPLLC